jgi:hypothetical protein
MTSLTAEQLQARFIPFNTLRYSTDAFIDYRIPGCGPKKNYALIGPGVSQNPNQPGSFYLHARQFSPALGLQS